MGAIRRFFTLKGRSNRLPYWITTIAVAFVVLVVALQVLFVFLPDNYDPNSGVVWVFAIGAVAMLLVVPITTRRLHDRDRSAWWLVPYLVVPFIIGEPQDYAAFGLSLDPDLAGVLNVVAWGLTLVALVDLGLLRGTDGPNRYGPDPLNPEAYDPADADVFD